jgi:hypothetical protein
MSTNALPDFLRTMIDKPPVAGTGVHQWLFKVARQLHTHYPATEIVRVLETAVAQCGRNVSHNEIVEAVRNSIPCAWQPRNPGAPIQAVSKWPRVNQEQREAIIRDGPGLCALWETSPIRIEDNEPHTEAIIDQLFPGNPLLCVGKYIPDGDGATKHYTKPRTAWCDLHQWELIVPSPMSAPTGLTQEGKESAHSLNNTGDRRFLVCEFDTGSTDNHAGLLLHLGTFAPLCLAVHSGGKSLHGWFFCAGVADDTVLKFFRYAVSLGADPATWSLCQFVRMPGGCRGKDKHGKDIRQVVFFFNPRPIHA